MTQQELGSQLILRIRKLRQDIGRWQSELTSQRLGSSEVVGKATKAVNQFEVILRERMKLDSAFEAEDLDSLTLGQLISRLGSILSSEELRVLKRVNQVRKSIHGVDMDTVLPPKTPQLIEDIACALGFPFLDWSLPDARGRFGPFGGRFVPETLMTALGELERAFAEAQADPSFRDEMGRLLRDFAGRPTPLYLAENLSKRLGGALPDGRPSVRIYLKREDLAHTGAHKINNALGQGLLARRLGKRRVIAETGAGQHGVAVATVCAMLGQECIVYMGEEDIRRQALNVFRMKLLGAEVRVVESGSRTLKDAINEAIRDWVSNVTTTHYLLGSAVGPHPYPLMVREFQSVIGSEAREQMLAVEGRLPDYAVACVGGGSNAIGLFHPFYHDTSVRLIGVEAAGEGLKTGHHAASLVAGRPGVLHGSFSYLLQDEAGQVTETHSISAGLDYPGVGPEHSFYKESGRAEYVAATDQEALDAFRLLSETEGIIPALEPAHAIAHVAKLAPTLPPDTVALLGLSGRGDKDMETVAKALGVELT